MRKRSKNVDKAIKALYATLATAAAKKALLAVELLEEADTADAWMVDFIRWIEQAGSDATSWVYTRPRPSQREG